MRNKMSDTDKRLVSKHLEDFPIHLLEKAEIFIGEDIIKKQGLYVLKNGEDLWYVGLASTIRERLKQHTQDGHKGKWDNFSIYLIEDYGQLQDLETILIKVADPEGNDNKGRKFVKSQNLKWKVLDGIKEFKNGIKNTDDSRRSKTNREGKKRSRIKVAKTPGKGKLQDKLCFGRTFAIRYWYKRKRYSAKLLKSGFVEFNGKRYESLSDAGKAVTGKGSNPGWNSWKYKNKRGDWVPIAELRKR